MTKTKDMGHKHSHIKLNDKKHRWETQVSLLAGLLFLGTETDGFGVILRYKYCLERFVE